MENVYIKFEKLKVQCHFAQIEDFVKHRILTKDLAISLVSNFKNEDDVDDVTEINIMIAKFVKTVSAFSLVLLTLMNNDWILDLFNSLGNFGSPKMDIVAIISSASSLFS